MGSRRPTARAVCPACGGSFVVTSWGGLREHRNPDRSEGAPWACPQRAPEPAPEPDAELKAFHRRLGKIFGFDSD